MSGNPPLPESPAVLARIYRLYRDYFDLAEKKRRWSLREDIPWDECNRSLDPVIADVVQTFCQVELFLPDYVAKLLPQVRANRGRAWMLANWGYEESKHSMALGDWLLRAGMRSDEEMADVDAEVFRQEWDLPYDNPRGMVCYTMLQELSTALHYQNLRNLVRQSGGDPALEKVLSLLATDERAHYQFFRRLVEIYLEYDRPGTLEQLRRVINTFAMPAVHLLLDGRRRVEMVRSLRLFDYDIFYTQVFEPVLACLKVDKSELRSRKSRETVRVSGRMVNL